MARAPPCNASRAGMTMPVPMDQRRVSVPTFATGDDPGRITYQGRGGLSG